MDYILKNKPDTNVSGLRIPLLGLNKGGSAMNCVASFLLVLSFLQKTLKPF